jgi:hypothetical protein
MDDFFAAAVASVYAGPRNNGTGMVQLVEFLVIYWTQELRVLI